MLQISRLLLLAGASANQSTNVMKNSSVLGVASYLGFLDFINLLLHHGADPNKTNNDGDTPLIQAAAEGHTTTVETLVKNGANVAIRNALEETALVTAAAHGHLNIVSFLLKCKWPKTMLQKQAQQALVTAARNGHAQVSSPYTVFLENCHGFTPSINEG